MARGSGTVRHGSQSGIKAAENRLDILSERHAPRPTMSLKTLSSEWRKGDSTQRWEVVNSLFERIHVRQDRKVEGYTPRMDRANRVRLLIGTAFDYVYEWSEREAEGPGASNRLRRGKGGIRTLEGALHPLPA
jgi:hypothetical protein